MAYDRKGLQRVGPQNSAAPSLYTYGTADTLATCDTSGYFSDAADILKVGDIIMVVTTTGPAAGTGYVNSNTRDLAASPPVRGVVDTTDFTVFGTADTD